MKAKWMAALAAMMGTVALAGTAGAQEKDQSPATKSDKLAPVANALELTIGTGYAQGFGEIGTNMPKLTDIGQPGGALQVGVGYRIIPQLALGIYGAGAMFSRGDQVNSSTNLYSAAAGVQADWHFLPSANQ